MKKLLLILICSISIWAVAQNTVNISPQVYNNLKQHHQLDLSKHYIFSGSTPTQTVIKPSAKALVQRTPSSLCSCLIPLDTTFTVVPFTNGIPPDYRNDDGSTNLISLPFTFNLYGNSYNAVYINNNGNISFLAPYYNFTANPFPDSSFNMIAPFWGDVDTRDSLSGLVYYKITPTSMIVKWENVGYYYMHSNLLSSFQLIITDGTDPILPAGDNVSFCYGDMNWTTGDASLGTNGFGGSPATVGVNMGNGTDYFQVGAFDSSGTAFDGPYGAADKVDWLDNQGMYFNTAVTGNIPPIIINNNICDTIDVYTGDTTRTMFVDSVYFTIGVSTPEIGQNVSAVITSSTQPANFSYSMGLNSPTYKAYNCKFIVRNLAPGVYQINIKAMDNGTSNNETDKTIYIRSVYNPGQPLGIQEKTMPLSIIAFPNPVEESLTIRHGFSQGSNPVLTLTDILGKDVLKINLINQEQIIDMSQFQNGIYFATISSTEGKSKTIKIVKNKH